jgi:hypothetical protein
VADVALWQGNASAALGWLLESADESTAGAEAVRCTLRPCARDGDEG